MAMGVHRVLIPNTSHICGVLLKQFYKFLVCDRGFLDFVAWVIVTLNHLSFLNSAYGKFLLKLAFREEPIYLYADLEALSKRADVPRGFAVRELAVYSVIARYFARCSIDTGRNKPVSVAVEVIQCLEKQRR
jgi:hypothetical protein